MKTIYYAAGAIFGVALVALCYIIVAKRRKRENIRQEYDERQLWVQGRAYKAGFFSLMIFCFVYGLADVLIERHWCEPIVGLTVCVCLSVVIWASICIWHDAYFKASQSPRHYKILFACASLVNIFLGVFHMIEGDLLENGVLGIHSLNFIAGIMLLAIFIVTVVKDISDRRESE